MKLKQDFGVRAMLATMVILVFSAVILYALIAKLIDGSKAVDAVFSLAMLALGFYFGTKVGSSNTPPTE